MRNLRNDRKRVGFWLGGSFLFHALAVALFFLVLRDQPQPFQNQSGPIEVQVQWRERPSAGGRGEGRSQKSGGGSPSPLKKFAISDPFSMKKGANSSSGDRVAALAKEGVGDAFNVAREMSFEKEAELLPFFDAIWRKIDRTLVYPETFVKNREQASVKMEIVVDHRGRFTGELRRLESPSPAIETFVAALVVHALDQELPSSLWRREGEKWTLGLDFRFQLKVRGGDAGGSMLAFRGATRNKNWLTFGREAWVDPWLNQKVDELAQRFLPPVIALPGGIVAIDVVRTYHLIQRWRNRGVKPDKMERAIIHRELEMEQWRTAIKKRVSPESGPVRKSS